MKKIEKRAVLCIVLAAALLLGLGIYLYRFVRHGASWASFPSNRHLYNSQGQLASGTVTDRDGDILTQVNEDGGPIMTLLRCVARRCTSWVILPAILGQARCPRLQTSCRVITCLRVHIRPLAAAIPFH